MTLLTLLLACQSTPIIRHINGRSATTDISSVSAFRTSVSIEVDVRQRPGLPATVDLSAAHAEVDWDPETFTGTLYYDEELAIELSQIDEYIEFTDTIVLYAWDDETPLGQGHEVLWDVHMSNWNEQ